MQIIDKQGYEALTFRTLASMLGVTPMAIAYHIGTRDQMLGDLAAQAFEDVADDVIPGTPSTELRQYLVRYSERALENTDLVRFMLSRPNFLPKVLEDFTAQIRVRTQSLNKGDPDGVMLNLVIDYIHGFVFAADAAPPDIDLSIQDCMKSIDWLIDTLPHRK